MKKRNRDQDKFVKRFMAVLIVTAVIVSGVYIAYRLFNNISVKNTVVTFTQEQYSDMSTDAPGIIKTNTDPQTITISMGGREHSAGLGLEVHDVRVSNKTMFITAGYSMSDAITNQKIAGALASKITFSEKIPNGEYQVKLNLINLGSVTVKPDWSQTGSIYTSKLIIK